MSGTIVNAVQIEVGAKDVGGSVKSIKTELREAKAEAILMARQFGETSKEATDAARKVAKLTDEVEDLGVKIKGLNPDKFARIASIGQGIAQGFVAAQGAMALFGSDSKELEKTMVKLQGAIAFSQGLQGLKDLKLALGAAFGPLTIAAGIITAIVANWKELSETVTKSFPGFQKVIDFFKNFRQIAAGTIDAVAVMFKDLGQGIWKILTLDISEGIDQLSNIGKDMATAYHAGYEEKDNEIRTNLAIKRRKFELDLLEAQGQDVAQKRLQLMRDELTMLEKGSDEYNSKLLEIERLRTKILTDGIAARKKAQEDAEKEKLAAFEAQAKLNKEAFEREAASDKAIADQRIADMKADRERGLAEEAATQAEVERMQREIDAKKKKRDEDELQAERNLQQLKYQAITGGLNAIADIYTAFAGKSEAAQKRAFLVQKAANIATTIIDTYMAAQGAYKSQMAIPTPDAPVRGAIAAGIAIASGLARLAKIKATEFNSSAISAPTSQSFTPPSINTPISQQRQITGNSTGSTGLTTQTNAVKVYVTDTDIKRVGGRNNDLERRATVK